MSTNFPFVILRKCESMDSKFCSFFIFCNLEYPFSHKRTCKKKDKKFVCDINSIPIIYLRTKNGFLFNFLIEIGREWLHLLLMVYTFSLNTLKSQRFHYHHIRIYKRYLFSLSLYILTFYMKYHHLIILEIWYFSVSLNSHQNC